MKQTFFRVKRATEKLFDRAIVGTFPVSIEQSGPIAYKHGAPNTYGLAFSPYDDVIGWGGTADSHCIFRVTFAPRRTASGFRICLSWRDGSQGFDAVNPQFTAYINGRVVQGLDINHTRLPIPDGCDEVLIYAYTGPKEARRLHLQAQLIVIDTKIESLAFDFDVLLGQWQLSEATSYRAAILDDVCNRAADEIDFSADGQAFAEGIAKASNVLREGIQTFGESCRMPSKAYCVGHTHIDIAWLWTAEQTEEKAERSFATVLALMDRYPEYKFVSSQPILYEFVKHRSPDLYRKILRRISEGRWEAEGGTWLEADCIMTGGESLVRQLYYGKKFFREEFGIRSRVLWMPDSFGFVGSLPQLLRQCGIEWFVFSKLSWNDTEKFPYDLFRWIGIDGSEISAYSLTAREYEDARKNDRSAVWYNGKPTPSQLAGAWDCFGEKALTDRILFVYGYGDGGGGPTEVQLEYIRRLSRPIEPVPAAHCATVKEFLSDLSASVDADRLPVWNGELYLQFHRGTYTSIGSVKRRVRKAESDLLKTEWLASATYALFGRTVDPDLYERAWKILMQNQFHDVLPGSAIREVYEESERTFGAFDTFIEAETDACLTLVAGEERGEHVLVCNPNAFPVSDTIAIGQKRILVRDVPAQGWMTLPANAPSEASDVRLSDHMLENDVLRVHFADDGTLDSVFDKRLDRELLKPGRRGNVLRVFDMSTEYEFEAWEIKPFYARRADEVDRLLTFEAFDEGDRKGFCVVRAYRGSTVTQRIFLQTGDPMLTFETEADWQESDTLLKAEFPVDIRARYAECGIPFGTVLRPVMFNTGWERAQYEVCVHKFADLSQSDHGVALISDCKYGYDFSDGLRLSLLKVSRYPNDEWDKGKHVFRYALYPHVGSFATSDVTQRAYAFEHSLFVRRTEKALAPFSLVSSDCDHIIVECVKPVDNGFVLRLYEAKNADARVCLTFGVPVANARLCTPLDEPIAAVPVKENTVMLVFRPFEIKSLSVVTKESDQ